MSISKLAVLFGVRALAVKEWHVDENAPSKVIIEGRKAGLIGWFLSLLRIDSTTRFELKGNYVTFLEGSLAGQINEIVPLTGTCNLGTGYLKPFSYIIAAGFCFVWFVLGLFNNSVGGIWVFLRLVMSVGLVVLYFLNKCMVFYVIPDSNSPVMIAFKRSIIEGVDVDEDSVNKVIRIMSSSIRGAMSK